MFGAAKMGDLDFLGADGGKIALAFAAGCVATWGFLKTLFTSPLRQRVKDLEAGALVAAEQLKAEQARCAQMETRLIARIEQLETIITFAGPLRGQIQAAISSMHEEIVEAKRPDR